VTIQVGGIITGRRIELERDLGLPDGTHVNVTVAADTLTVDEKRKLVSKLCGAWAADPTIGPIFEEIERNRR
jgi:hypothetical protein